MSALQVAAEHGRRRARLAARIRQEARRAWAAVDPRAISESWLGRLPRLIAAVIAGQRAAAGSADLYLTDVLAEQGLRTRPSGLIVPDAFAGIASDGRSLDSLLALPAIVAKTAIGQGHPLERAMAAGGALAELAAHTQVADAGRISDQVALVVRVGAAGYTRMVIGDSCARCLILAGRTYRWNAGFLRHPKCDCIHIPTADDSPDDLRTNPRLAFEAMDPAEQDRVFTKAGAEAIREGADMARVVNARRGMYEAGGKLLTTEATTRRGTGRRIRPMPEQIYREAGDDRDEAIRLLRRHGYLTGQPTRRPAPDPKPAEADVRTVPEPAPRTPTPSPPEPAPIELSAEDLLRSGIASGIREEAKLTSGSVGTVHLVTFNDGSQAIRKVANQAMFQYSPIQLTENELLAAKVGQAVRAPIPAVVRTGDTEVFMEYVPDARPGQWLFRDFGAGEAIAKVVEYVKGSGDLGRRLGLLDLLIANDDRHDQNWLVREDGKGSIVGIDHGLVWPKFNTRPEALDGPPHVVSPFAKLFATSRGFVENDLTEADLDWVEERLKVLRPDFDELGQGARLDYSLARLRQLRQWARGTANRIKP